MVLAAIIVPIIIIVIGIILFSDTSGVPRSTVKRTAITNVAPGDTLRYRDATDAGNWFSGNSSDLNNGAAAAHRLTGVKFGVFVMDGVYSNSELEEAADMIYEDWFDNSGSHLLIFLIDQGDGNYNGTDMVGASAQTVFDGEALDILWGYIDSYWRQPERYSEYELFGLALQNTAERIMSVTPTFGTRIAPFIGVSIVVLIVFIGIIIALKASTKRKLAAAAEAQANAELLGQDLKEFGSTNDAASELEKQYQDKNNKE